VCSLQSTSEKPDDGRRLRTARTILSVNLLVNGLLTTAVALCHPYSKHDIHWSQSLLSRIAAQHQVFLEALLLVIPPWLTGIVIARWAPRTGVVTGVFLIATVPILTVLEIVSWLTLRTHFLSAETLEMVTAVLPWINVYTTQTGFLPLGFAVVGFLSLQAVSVLAGLRLARRQDRMTVEHRAGTKRSGQPWMACVAVILMLVPVAGRLLRPQDVFTAIVQSPDRHPVAATGWFVRDTAGDPEFLEPQQIRVATHFIRYQPALKRFDEDYRHLKLAAPPQRQPDILVILAESLRHDALTARSAPNLTGLAMRSLTSQQHFSAGNASEFGFFSLLYGLDPMFAPHAMRELPAAMPQVMQQAGYFRAFLGFGELDMNLIDTFVHAGVFDYFSSRSRKPFYRRDEEVIAETQALLARTGRWARLQDQPVFAMLYLFTTHSEYHYTPQDEVFVPSPRDSLPSPPWTPRARNAVLNRYHNSVRCLDRMLAPLLTDDRIIVFVGDHGESFGDDQRLFHGTALSFTQTQTPLVIQIPGRPPENLPGPTSHEDVLPTLLDALGTGLDLPEILTGRSLLSESDPEEEVFTLRATVTGEQALLDFSNSAPLPFFRFEMDLRQPWFRLRDANDQHQQAVHWSSQQALAFESDLRDWLDRRLRIDSGPISQQPLHDLILFLEQGNQQQVLMALSLLQEMGPDARPAMQVISRHLVNQNPEIRSRSKLLLRNLADSE